MLCFILFHKGFFLKCDSSVMCLLFFPSIEQTIFQSDADLEFLMQFLFALHLVYNIDSVNVEGFCILYFLFKLFLSLNHIQSRSPPSPLSHDILRKPT